MLKAALNGLAHVACRLRLAMNLAGAQILDQLFLGPTADTAIDFCGDVWRIPYANKPASEPLLLPFLHQEATRDMARGTMRNVIDRIRASIPIFRLLRLNREWFRVEEKQIPYFHRRANVHRKREIRAARRLIYRQDSLHEIAEQRMDVRVREDRIGRIGRGGIRIGHIGPNASAEHISELLFIISTNTETHGSRNIRRINGPHRRAYSEASGERLAVGRCVTGRRVRCLREIFATLDHVSGSIICLRCTGKPCTEQAKANNQGAAGQSAERSHINRL